MCNVPLSQIDRALIGLVEPGNETECRGLSAARGAEQRHELSDGEVEGQPVERLHCTVAPRHAVKPNRGTVRTKAHGGEAPRSIR